MCKLWAATIIHAWFRYGALVKLSELANATGRTSEGGKLAVSAQRLRDGINAIMYNETLGRYCDGPCADVQHTAFHASMFSLFNGIVPPDRAAGVFKWIKDRGMVCSVYGAWGYLQALYKVGPRMGGGSLNLAVAASVSAVR